MIILKPNNIFYYWIISILIIFKGIEWSLASSLNIPDWINTSIYLVNEVLLLSSFILFILFDKNQNFRFGLFFSLFLFGIARFENYIALMLMSIVVALLILFIRKVQSKGSMLQFILFSGLCLCYYFYELNIGNRFTIYGFKYLSFVFFIWFSIVHIKNNLIHPNKITLVYKVKKPNWKRSLIVSSIILIGTMIMIVFELFLSNNIKDYKYNRFKNNLIMDYYSKQSDFDKLFSELQTFPNVQRIEFFNDKINIKIIREVEEVDTVDCYFGNSITYPDQYSFLTKIDLTSDSTLHAYYPEYDTVIEHKKNWELFIQNQTIDENEIQLALKYLGIDQNDILNLKKELQKINCYGISKYDENNISFYQETVALKQFGVTYCKTCQTKENDVESLELKDSVFWFRQEYCCIDFAPNYYFYMYNIY